MTRRELLLLGMAAPIAAALPMPLPGTRLYNVRTCTWEWTDTFGMAHQITDEALANEQCRRKFHPDED